MSACPFGYDCFHCPAADCIVLRFPKSRLFPPGLPMLVGKLAPLELQIYPPKPFRGSSGTYYSMHREAQLLNAKLYYRSHYVQERERMSAYYLAHRDEKILYQRDYRTRKKLEGDGPQKPKVGGRTPKN